MYSLKYCFYYTNKLKKGNTPQNNMAITITFIEMCVTWCIYIYMRYFE